ncbi:glycosyltransferase [Aeromicrobium alkaliterrae]
MTLAFPEARRFCLWNDDPTRFPGVEESWLARSPLRRSKPAALPFMRAAGRGADLGGADLVLSSSHVFGHAIASRAARRGIRAFAYVHSPARYIWAPEYDPRGRSLPVRTVAPALRRVDRRSVDPRVSYAANSAFVAERMAEAWGVEARVIHPPVAVANIVQSMERPLSEQDAEAARQLPAEFVLGASRLVDYKRVDAAIDLGSSLGVPVVIAGDGPDRERLQAVADSAGVRVQFLGRVSDRLLHELYRRALLFVFAAVEDFGIMPLEAVTAGAPVVVNREGGAWEGVSATGAGASCDPDDPDELRAAAETAIGLRSVAGSAATADFADELFRSRVVEWTSGE